MAGMGYGKADKPMPAGPKDLASAIEEAPAEVEPDADDELDAEQAGLAQEIGLSPEQGAALRRFIETMV